MRSTFFPMLNLPFRAAGQSRCDGGNVIYNGAFSRFALNSTRVSACHDKVNLMARQGYSSTETHQIDKYYQASNSC